MFIKVVTPKVIKDSRKERTIQVEIKTYKGKFVASAPSGKSTGKYEVQAYSSRGLIHSMKLARVLAKRLENKNFMIRCLDDLQLLESEIIKVENSLGKIGGNVRYAFHTVFLKAAAYEAGKDLWEFIKEDNKKVKMPMPIGNCIGGGLHSKGKRPDFQEFLLIPDEEKFSRAITHNVRAYELVKKIRQAYRAQKKTWKQKKNDESAWQVSLTNELVLEVLSNLAKEKHLRIGLDIAASSFCDKKGIYDYKNKEIMRDRNEQIDYLQRLIKKFNIFYIEDPLHEDDFMGFKQLLGLVGKDSLIVGDDLTTTNLSRVQRAFRVQAINALIVKPNQIGSLLEVKQVVEFCKTHKIKMIFSHRSGETMDTALADFAVGFGADFVKMGIMGRERLIKHHRLMEIEKQLSR